MDVWIDGERLGDLTVTDVASDGRLGGTNIVMHSALTTTSGVFHQISPVYAPLVSPPHYC